VAYTAGDHVALRDVRNGVVYFAWPVTVIEDADRGLLVSQVPGAVGRVPRGYPDDLAELVHQLESRQPELVELEWKATRTLGVFLPDQWWATRLFWNADGTAFLGYYVDFIRPIERDGNHVNTLDLALDVVVRPDGSWAWKDEDHLPIMRTLGWLDDETERHMELGKTAVIAAVESKTFPFDHSLVGLCPAADALPAVLRTD
jgi:predicted RNA-binding protein associated with RNAse of E/G family